METFAVVWSESGRVPHVGKLELGSEGLRFGGRRTRSVPYGEIASVRVARDENARIGGRPALVLDLVAGGSLRIASFAGIGVLSELAERLSYLSAAATAG
jgi:hypothetical protein